MSRLSLVNTRFLANKDIHHTISLSPAILTGEVRIAVLAAANLSFCEMFLTTLPTSVFFGGENRSHLNQLGLTY
jgi:hypothetical protein